MSSLSAAAALSLLLPLAASAQTVDALRRDIASAAQGLGKDISIRGGRCRRPVHVDAISKAWREAQAKSPEAAAAALTALQDSGDVAPHLGISLFMAVRSQGLDLNGGVYCDVDRGPGLLPERWIGASTAQGFVFILDLAAGEAPSPKGPARIFAAAAELEGKPLEGPFLSASPEEIFSCGPSQAYPFGSFGRLLEAVDRLGFKPWEETGRCAGSRGAAPPVFGPHMAPTAGDYDASAGRRFAETARRTVEGKAPGTGWCYKWALISMERAGFIRFPEDYEFGGGGVGVPYNPAYRFGVWADAHPDRLRAKFGMRKIETPASRDGIPVGSIVVYSPGTCGFHKTAGHIEVAVGGGVGCSDHCRPMHESGCFDGASSAGVRVYMPVR